MATETITTRTKGMDPVSVEYDFGDNLEEAVEAYGENVVFDLYHDQAVIALQNYVRRLMKQGKTQEEIQQAVSAWRPGVSTRQRKSPAEKLRQLLQGVPKEQVQKMLAEMGLA